MELKNQILLVILIPILLILCLAIFQVGLLGFVSIPTFQTSLLEFHINRHINGMSIEMKILSQEMFIQNQAYFNQLLGIAAHLRYYTFGYFKHQNNWQFKDLTISPDNFFTQIMGNKSSNVSMKPRTLDWYHPNYTSLKEFKQSDNDSYQLLNQAAHSLHLGDLLINVKPIQFDQTSEEIFSEDESSNDDQHIAIEYEYMQLICTDGMVLRYPAFSDHQLRIIKQQSTEMYKNDSNMLYDPTLFQGERNLSFRPGDVLNFTLNIEGSTQFDVTTGINLQQIISTDKNSTCALNVKILNNYLNNLTQADQKEHLNQQEHQHNLFIALNQKNLTVVSSPNYSNSSLSQAIFNKFLFDNYDTQSALAIISASNNSQTDQIHSGLLNLIHQIRTQNSNNQTNGTSENYFTFIYEQYELYILMNLVDTKSDKQVLLFIIYKFSELTDPSNNITYLHIAPQTNNYTYPTFVVVHTFEKKSLIADLYIDTSLDQIKTLEIVVFIVIVVLSISESYII